MSHVTNIILTWSVGEIVDEHSMDKLNKFFEDKERPSGLVHIDTDNLPAGWYGGSKMMEANVALGAFNYIDMDKFMDYITNFPWQYPEDVVVMVQEQHQNNFNSYRIDLDSIVVQSTFSDKEKQKLLT